MLNAVLAVSICACQDGILSQKSPSAFDAEMIFSNYELAQSAFDGIWEELLDGQCYCLRYMCYYGTNTDIEINIGSDETNTAIQRYNATPTHARLNGTSSNPEAFSRFYQAIEKANLVIDGITSYADIENDEKMRILYAQTLTMRAHIYYDLIKAWGDVPARFVPVAKDELYKPKVSRDIIFRQILADLDRAIPMLPYPGEHAMTASAYKVNRIYAAGLFGRIALMASGYAQRPSDGNVGTGDSGTVRLSSDPDMSKEVLYPRALAHLSEVIAAEKMTLAPDYKEYWRKFNNAELASMPNEETVFMYPYTVLGRWNYTFAVRVNSNTVINGFTVSRNPVTGPSPALYFDYDVNDKRRNVTCFNSVCSGENAITANIAQWYFGKFRFDQMASNPWEGDNNDSIKPVAMRYSDILLMAAEIANELGDLTAAKAYMRPVRVRAFDEVQADAFLGTLNDKETFFNAIVDERAFEFCGELIRKADLIRWNLLKAKMDETKSKLYALRDRAEPYDWIPKKVYYKVNPEDRWELIYYGYNPGEDGLPDGPVSDSDETKGKYWTSRTFCTYDNADVSKNFTTLSDVKIESVYVNDPDKHQFWPIPANAITNSQGKLVNDYNY